MAIQLLIDVDDRGKPVIKSMTEDVKKLGTQAEKTSKKQKTFLTKTNKLWKAHKLAIVAGVVAVGAMTIKLTNMASAAEEVANKFNVVFKGVGNATDELKKMRDETGYAVSSLQQMTSSLGDLIKPAGFSADAAFNMSKQITQLSLDLGSFNNLRPQDVVQDFQSALAGSAETLLKYGIDVKEGALAQEAFNLGLTNSVKAYSNLDSSTKRQVRTQALISRAFKDSKDAVGDLARTQNSYANQTKRMQEGLKESGESLGKFLMPAMTSIVTFANKAITAFTKLISFGDIEIKPVTELFKQDIKDLEYLRSIADSYGGELEKIDKDHLESLKAQYGFQSVTTEQMDIAIGKAKNLLTFESERLKKLKEMATQPLPTPTPTGAGAADAAKKAADAKVAALVKQSEWMLKLKEMSAEASAAAIENNEKEQAGLNQKLAIRQDFNSQFQQLTMSEWDLKRQKIDEMAIIFHDAGVADVALQRWVTDSKKNIFLEETAAKAQSVASLIGAFGQLNQAAKGSAIVSKRLAQAAALVDTYAAANKALASGIPPWNFIAMAAVIAAGLANVTNIEKQKFQHGVSDFIVPPGYPKDSYMVGLTSGEKVNVTPANQTTNNNNANNYFNINISTQNIDEFFVRTKLIPMLNRSVRDRNVPMYASRIV